MAVSISYLLLTGFIIVNAQETNSTSNTTESVFEDSSFDVSDRLDQGFEQWIEFNLNEESRVNDQFPYNILDSGSNYYNPGD